MRLFCFGAAAAITAQAFAAAFAVRMITVAVDVITVAAEMKIEAKGAVFAPFLRVKRKF